MNRRTQHRNPIPGACGRAAIVAIVSAITPASAILAMGTAQAQSFATFEAPGAGKGASQGTLAFGINPAGEVAGEYVDANGVYHGFVRAVNGAITGFEAKDAGKGSGQGTMGYAIGPAGNGYRNFLLT
jgi:hypothetical protein